MKETTVLAGLGRCRGSQKHLTKLAPFCGQWHQAHDYLKMIVSEDFAGGVLCVTGKRRIAAILFFFFFALLGGKTDLVTLS